MFAAILYALPKFFGYNPHIFWFAESDFQREATDVRLPWSQTEGVPLKERGKRSANGCLFEQQHGLEWLIYPIFSNC